MWCKCKCYLNTGLTCHTRGSKSSSSSKYLFSKSHVGGGAEMWRYPLTLLQGSNTPHTASQHSNEDARLSPRSPLTVNRPMGLFGVTLHPYSHYSLIETHPLGRKHTHKHRQIYRKLHHLPKHRIPLPEKAVSSKKRGSINNGSV